MSYRVAAILALLLTPHALSAQWRTAVSTDEMTGEQSAYAHSSSVSPTEPMGFPYSGTSATLSFGCDSDSEWAYFGFSEAPNLTDTDTRDGYNLIRTRIRWDDSVENIELSQSWGERFVHFRDYSEAIGKILASSSVLLELNWYGEGRTYFRISLAGSGAAIAEAREACRAGARIAPDTET